MDSKKKFYIELIEAFLLIFVGGFLTAYSFILKNGTYANMHTGNLMKFLIGITEGKFLFENFLPLITFIVSMTLASLIVDLKHSKFISIIIQILLTIIVIFLPNTSDFALFSLCLITAVCGVQFTYFRKVANYTYSTIMCTNNMRIFTKTLAEFLRGKESFGKVLLYIIVNLCFSLGVISVALLIKAIDAYSIIITLPIYVAIGIMQFVVDKAK